MKANELAAGKNTQPAMEQSPRPVPEATETRPKTKHHSPDYGPRSHPGHEAHRHMNRDTETGRRIRSWD